MPFVLLVFDLISGKGGLELQLYACAARPHLTWVVALGAMRNAAVCRARDEAASYKEFYGCPIPGKVMAERLAGFVHAYTMYWSVRPFGSAVLIAGKDADGPFLWMVR